MNIWRYLGISLFLLGALCLISATKFPVLAGGQDKDKKENKKKDDTKKEDQKKDDTKKDDKKKDDTKKDDTKKEDAKKGDAKKGGDLVFKAFDGTKPFYQEQTTTTTQKMKVMNQEVEQKQKQTFIIEWTPLAKKDGNYVVVQAIVGVNMNIDIGGNKISYKSHEEDGRVAKNPKNPMTDFFEQLTKSKLTFTISPELKVLSVDGREEFIKGLSDINPQMAGLLKAILSKEALVKMAEPTWWAFPKDGDITKKTWTKESELDLGPIGNYKTNFEFTYKGQDQGAKDKDKIGIKTSLSYSAPTKNQGLPFIIQKADLKSESGDGEAIFDRAKGRFEFSKINMKLKGNLTIEVGNMNTTVELDQSQEATSTTTDTNPWEKKSP